MSTQRIKRSAISTAMLGAVAALALAPSYKAEAASLAPTFDSAVAKQIQQKSRYAYTSFGEAVDTKYCRDEAEVASAASRICATQGFSFVTPELIMSMAYQESKFIESAQNGTAMGMCQIKGEYHQSEMAMAGATDLSNMEDNLATCGMILELKAAEYYTKGFSKESAVTAAITHYHLNQDTAARYVAEGKVDGYTQSVLDRTQRISLNKSIENALLQTALASPEQFPASSNNHEEVEI